MRAGDARCQMYNLAPESMGAIATSRDAIKLCGSFSLKTKRGASVLKPTTKSSKQKLFPSL